MNTGTGKAAPRKAAPRKAAPRKAAPEEETPVSTALAMTDSSDRARSLRALLVAEGYDPDSLALAKKTAAEEITTDQELPPSSTPTEVDDGNEDVLPGVSLAGIRKIIGDARANPATEEMVLVGLRSMIEEHGKDPDAIIAAAMGTGDHRPGKKPEQDEPKNAFVDFYGRRIEVTAPSAEQVAVVRRIQRQFSLMVKQEELSADEAVRMIDRAISAVCSVVVDKDDAYFVEDLLLTGEATIEQAIPLLRSAMEALEKTNEGMANRAERRRKSMGTSSRASLVPRC